MKQYTLAAQQLVRNRLGGRTMDEVLLEAVVWLAADRLRKRMLPTLRATMCNDIDNQASSTDCAGQVDLAHGARTPLPNHLPGP